MIDRNAAAWRRLRISAALATAGTFLAVAALIAARRPDQIVAPEAWNEDGAIIVADLIQFGWRHIFVPVNGYLIIPSKVITYLALRISFLHYPAVSTALGVAAQAACATIIARAPTVMPLRLAMVGALLFVPTDPEVFVLPQYTLWWTPLLIFVALLWSGPPESVWRYLLILVGGVSAPVILATMPVLAFNAVVRRRRSEWLLLLVGAAAGGVQALSILTTDTISSNTFRVAQLPMVIEKYFGALTWAGQARPLAAGSLILGLLACGLVLLPKPDRLPYLLLGGCVAGTIASAVYRVPVEILHPVLAGPRYFFYPFVLELWMVIWLAARIPAPLRILPALVLIAAIPLSAATFVRHQSRLGRWTPKARACNAGVDTVFRIHHDGTRTLAHSVLYPAALCQIGVRNALFDRMGTQP